MHDMQGYGNGTNIKLHSFFTLTPGVGGHLHTLVPIE